MRCQAHERGSRAAVEFVSTRIPREGTARVRSPGPERRRAAAFVRVDGSRFRCGIPPHRSSLPRAIRRRSASSVREEHRGRPRRFSRRGKCDRMNDGRNGAVKNRRRSCMSLRAAFGCCLALILYPALAGCASDRETRFAVSKELASGMSRQEVQSLIARDGSLSPPITYVRNSKGVFAIQGPGDDSLVAVPERYLQSRTSAYATRVRKIVARIPRNWPGSGRLDVLCYERCQPTNADNPRNLLFGPIMPGPCGTTCYSWSRPGRADIQQFASQGGRRILTCVTRRGRLSGRQSTDRGHPQCSSSAVF